MPKPSSLKPHGNFQHDQGVAKYIGATVPRRNRVGLLVTRARVELGLTQAELGELVGYSREGIGHVENAIKRLPLHHAAAVCRVMQHPAG